MYNGCSRNINLLFIFYFYFYFPRFRFAIEVLESNQDRLKALVVLKDKLDYNEQMIYHLVLAVTVSQCTN